MKNKIFYLVLITYLTVGCDDTKSIDWYKEHPDKMHKRNSECKQLDKHSDDCQNAMLAERRWRQSNVRILDWGTAFKEDIDKVKETVN
ncbi:EexN family lipoprotein [Enterobacter wuhouensis]|uniref:EexN family lipoprotein n=1 Tax=Enterobacter wuhouensis TaxID=2529381 RepID=A0ABZ1DK72_9ENTR|nr:EexN family lipoprotein [Enterobacter wuhouensis]WRW31676.1 EexN family lipoprotein [Enterobacter wuhouensis]